MTMRDRVKELRRVKASELRANPKNWRLHPPGQEQALRGVLEEIGFADAMIVRETPEGLELIDGHLRRDVMGDQEVPVLVVDVSAEEADKLLLTVDPLAMMAHTDNEQLLELLQTTSFENDAVSAMLEALANGERDIMPDFTEPPDDGTFPFDNSGKSLGSLSERFLIPPFSVLDARQGYWQSRKRAWLDLGIESELGRDGNLIKFSDTILMAQQKGLAQTFGTGHYIPVKDRKMGHLYQGTERAGFGGDYDVENGESAWGGAGTSIFDPVLCELAYSWFCPPGGSILDPFAGGSVRGIVASYLGRKYTGIELRQGQVDENRKQAENVVPDNLPTWIVGDSRRNIPDAKYDLVFSCPPYYDLEQYSDDESDLSNAASYEDFIADYRLIVARAVDALADDSFACFVVGDIRDKGGIYRNFVSNTISAFQDAGANYYNEGILVNSVGSLPIRVGRQFTASRKLGKTHQNVLVFFKGDPGNIRERLGDVDVSAALAIFEEGENGDEIDSSETYNQGT